MSTRAETPGGGFADPRAWWLAQWKGFNRVPLISGVAAVVAYHVALTLCDPETLGTGIELSILALVGQAMMLGVFLVVANILYALVYALAIGAEGVLRPRGPARFRRRLYLLGVVVMAAVPWYVPVSAAVWCLTTPPPPPREALAPPAVTTLA